MLNWRPALWQVPTDLELDEAEEFLWHHPKENGHVHNVRWCSLRKIILNENRNCIAHPVTHVQGLIPFLQQNHRLRVERRVDINHAIVTPRGAALAKWYDIFDKHPEGHWIHTSLEFMALWIIEEMALKDYGLLDNSFSLTFEGLPGIQEKLWDGLKQMAAVQKAMVEYAKRSTPNHLALDDNLNYFLTYEPSILFLSRPKLYFADALPQAIKDMIKATSYIHLPVWKGDVWDVEEVLANVLADEDALVASNHEELFENIHTEEEDLGISYDSLKVFYWNELEEYEDGMDGWDAMVAALEN
ncbi:hypothetical protein BU23DRAFT_659420 [Bimuria novae-zelandiae CBS 107.79]|uniref:Uncharacterized protein n=1 Tax=Bimuria novae-zelandiae CBS 107.79 TaxID=1447943 RepID=A0A6A5UWQ0_9PLEO|nr:hypothetical protein BU23DRAFT_659420 [Bimuria novae-zelandiae CBS 107.79]